MDTLLEQGDHAVDHLGVPIAISGIDSLLQQAVLRLCIPKGSFAYDTTLGSHLHQLVTGQGAAADRAALSFASEALAPIPEVTVQAAQCRRLAPDQLEVLLSLQIQRKTFQLEVRV